MQLSHRDFKTLVYVAETLFGIILLIVGWHCLSQASEDPLSNGVSGVVLLALGLFELLFGFEAYIVREESDIRE